MRARLAVSRARPAVSHARLAASCSMLQPHAPHLVPLDGRCVDRAACAVCRRRVARVDEHLVPALAKLGAGIEDVGADAAWARLAREVVC